LVPSGLFEALIQAESRGRHYRKDGELLKSSKGAAGISQLMPGTMRDPGYGIKPVRDESLEENLRVGREYLGAMMKKYRGNVDHALAAYNWGPGNVDKWLRRGGDPSELPRETRAYIPKIKNFMAQQQRPEPVRVAERPQMDEDGLAGIPAGQFMPVSDRVGMPPLLRRPLERVTRLLPSAEASGIDELPAGMQSRMEYASGGITSFQTGGLNVPLDLQTPFDTSGGSNTVYGRTTTDMLRPRAPEEETSSMFGRGVRAMGSTIADIFSAPPGASERYAAQQDVLARQQALRNRLQQLEGYGFRQQTKAQQAEAEQIRKELSALEGQLRVAARTQSAPPSGPSGITPYKTKTVDGVREDHVPLETYQERLARRQTDVGYTDPKTKQRMGPDGTPIDAPPAPPAAPDAPSYVRRDIARPELELPGTKIDASFYQGKEPLELSELGKQRMDHMRSLGVDPDMYKNMLAAVEDKKGKLAARKGESKGEAMMRVGLGLIGSRQGREFEDLREHGLSALNQYKQDVKDLRASEERLDDRMDALRIADQQAKQSGAEKDIARRQQMEDSYEAAQRDRYKQQNEVRVAEAQLGFRAAEIATQFNTQMYGIDTRDDLMREQLQVERDKLKVTEKYYDRRINAEESRAKAAGQLAHARFLTAKQKIMEGLPSDAEYLALVKDLEGRYGKKWATIPQAQTELSLFRKKFLAERFDAGGLDLDTSGIKHESEY
jgi:hypothetical protein